MSLETDIIPIHDRIKLGPLMKYKKYSKLEIVKMYYLDLFPWKLVIHCLIVMLTTLQVLAIVETTGSYSYTQANLFYFNFLNSDGDEVMKFD